MVSFLGLVDRHTARSSDVGHCTGGGRESRHSIEPAEPAGLALRSLRAS